MAYDERTDICGNWTGRSGEIRVLRLQLTQCKGMLALRGAARSWAKLGALLEAVIGAPDGGWLVEVNLPSRGAAPWKRSLAMR